MTDAEFLNKIRSDNHGIFTAGVILQKIRDGLSQTLIDKKFALVPRNHMEKYPYLQERCEEFEEYSRNIHSSSFSRKWWRHLGGMVIPWYRKKGNIHLYLLDDGLLSKSLPMVPDLTYGQRSTFFLNRILGLDISDQRLKGQIHFHAIDIRDLKSFDIMGIKLAIAAEHESGGYYIEKASMVAFSLFQDCIGGGYIKGCPDLVTNRPAWFTEMFPNWLR